MALKGRQRNERCPKCGQKRKRCQHSQPNSRWLWVGLGSIGVLAIVVRLLI